MKESFNLLKVVSIVSQRFIPQGGYPGLMEVCKFLIGQTNEATIDIPPIINATKAVILKQHPWIGEIKVPVFKNLAQMERWCEKVIIKYGKEVEFEKPEKMMTKEEVFNQTITNTAKTLGISKRDLNESVKKAKKLLGVK